MSPTNRSKRPTNVPRPELKRKPERRETPEKPHAATPSKVERGPIQAMPEWNWKTFPVYAAFAGGIFFGVWMGMVAGVVSADGNSVPVFVVFGLSAVLAGTAFSRVVTRWMLARKWPRPKR
jgi:uncharacterized membrane protein YedE/YeeE